jgi:hypothetical protein
MMERLYMFAVGIAVLTGLYFDLRGLVYGLIALMAFEGLTNLRAANLFRPQPAASAAGRPPRFDFSAQRAWHLVVGSVLLISYGMFHGQLWFFTWFVAFAVTGAGLSGVCPVLVLLRAVGFR